MTGLGLRVSDSYVILAGLVVRLLLIVYGNFHDETFAVKYTDIDYKVFSDGAKAIADGLSPYDRQTFRYSPFFALILLPNLTFGHLCGKLLFSLIDCLNAYIILSSCKAQLPASPKQTLLSLSVWLFNPLTLTISTRGNADTLIVLFVLLTLHFIRTDGLIVAGICYGLSVHLKIYPVIYGPTILCNIFFNCRSKNVGLTSIIMRLMIFLLSSGLTLAFFSGLFYLWFGDDFIQNTYFYHLSRKDIRHNFSPFFYMLYLTENSPGGVTQMLGFLLFTPQIIMIAVSTVTLSAHLDFCCFLQIYAFVSFNKVCTSQYFVWFLGLLPLIIPRLRLPLRRSIWLFGLWIFSQGTWLLPAYLLEFQGWNTFAFVWLGGLFLLAVNVYIMGCLIDAYRPYNLVHKQMLVEEKLKFLVSPTHT